MPREGLFPPGLFGGLTDYFADAAPGGVLNAEWTPEAQAMAWDQAQNFAPVWGGIKGAREEWEAGNPGWAAFNAATVPLDIFTGGLGGAAAKGLMAAAPFAGIPWFLKRMAGAPEKVAPAAATAKRVAGGEAATLRGSSKAPSIEDAMKYAAENNLTLRTANDILGKQWFAREVAKLSNMNYNPRRVAPAERFPPAPDDVVEAPRGLLGDAFKKQRGRLGDQPEGKFVDYPRVVKPEKKLKDPKDPSKGTFESKVWSREAKAVDKLRKAAMKDIQAGTAPQYFDVSKRFYADPSKYGPGYDTASILPKKAETVQKWKDKYDTAAARETLTKGYQQGAKDPMAIDWYAMGQLEEAFIKEHGEKAGRDLFKERFADAMAATTGGADPTANLLMSHYGNYLKAAGKDLPAASHQYPYPIGGRYAAGNMAQYQKNIMGDMPGIRNPEKNPKRYNFSRNFLGDMDRATIDEQMMGGFGVPEKAPVWYGSAEGVVRDLAKEQGVKAGNFQDAAWFGLKGQKGGKAAEGKPMMSHINDMLYRTSQVTGETMDQVLKRYVNSKGAMYSGLLGAGLAAPMAGGLLNPDEI